MSERMAEISAHIDSVRQLGSVVKAIKGIAAARARNARAEVQAVDRYSAVIVEAVVSAFGHDIATCTHDTREQEPASDDASTGWLLFLAEQGFAGAFSERLLDSLGTALGSAPLMVVGTRGLSILAAREITPLWSAPMPSHSPGIPALADTLTTVIHDQLSKGHFERLELVYTRWEGGAPQRVHRRLLPLELESFAPGSPQDARISTPHTAARPRERPLLQLPPAQLLEQLYQDVVHAQLCQAALHAFAAENEARMQAMASAASQIERELADYKTTLQQVRQETITAEIIELGTGASSTERKTR